MPAPPALDVRLVRAGPLSPSVRELVFERVDGAPFVFDAGQWMNFVLPLDGGVARRAYSIASAPDGSPRFEIAVTHVVAGPGSTYLHGLAPGAVLRAEGPQGFFPRPLDGAPPALFVGTGTGVAETGVVGAGFGGAEVGGLTTGAGADGAAQAPSRPIRTRAPSREARRAKHQRGKGGLGQRYESGARP